MLGREIEEGQQLVCVIGDLRGSLGVLGAVGGGEVLDRLLRVLAVFGVTDLRQRLARRGLGRCGQAVQDIHRLVHPVPLLFGLGEHLPQRGPEPPCPVAGRQHRRAHAPPLGVAQQPGPGLGRLAVPVGQRDQLLLPVRADPMITSVHTRPASRRRPKCSPPAQQYT